MMIVCRGSGRNTGAARVGCGRCLIGCPDNLRCFLAILLTLLNHIPNCNAASILSALAIIIRPCLRMNFDLLLYSANGRAIRSRSSLARWIRSISRSDKASSSIPRNACSIYQSVERRIRTLLKNPIHSSTLGIPPLASLSSGAGLSDFSRDRLLMSVTSASTASAPASLNQLKSASPVSSASGTLKATSSSETMLPFPFQLASAVTSSTPFVLHRNHFNWRLLWLFGLCSSSRQPCF